MSADNWTTCPRCEVKDEERRAKLKKKAEISYGKVPPEEFVALREKANAPVELEPTLREDYQLGIHGGAFTVGYSAACHVCGFSFRFDHETPGSKLLESS